MNTRVHALLNHSALMAALLLLLPLLSGFLLERLYRLSQERDFLADLDSQTRSLAARLETQTRSGQAMGVAALLGRNEPLIRDLVKGQGPDDDPAVLQRLAAARQLLGAAGIYVVDRSGLVRAHETQEQGKTTGRNVAWRPYFQQAIQGRENIYAAVGSRSGKRGLYIASPIQDSQSGIDQPGIDQPSIDQPGGGQIIGIVLIKMAGDFLDDHLASMGHQGILLAPQGVVFAATDPDWRLRLTGPLDTERFERLKQRKQFGKHYNHQDNILALPFALEQRETHIKGQKYGFARASLEWNDPAGPWTLVQFENLRLASEPTGRMLVGLMGGAGVFLLLWMLLHALRARLSRAEALAAQQVAVQELAEASALQTQLAELTVQMQDCPSAEALAEVFFQALARLSPVHQATLYAAQIDAESNPGSGPVLSGLSLIGAYGIQQPPQWIDAKDGLVAECGRSQKSLCLADPPAGFWRIASGLGEGLPRSLLLFPLLRKQRLLGVLELASRVPLERLDLALIQRLLPLLAINLDGHLSLRQNERQLARYSAEIARLSAAAAPLADPLPESNPSLSPAQGQGEH
jgi:hypothetical protein